MIRNRFLLSHSLISRRHVEFGANESSGVFESQSKVVKVGITSSIGCGKSFVTRTFNEFGVPTLDSDQVVHDLYENDIVLREKVRQSFGEGIFTPEGKIDRKKLGQIIFNDPAKRKLLEQITHPRVKDKIQEFFDKNQQAKMAIVEVPLLFEANLEKLFDKVLVVKATLEQQIQRLMARGKGCTEEEARVRMNSQMSLAEKISRVPPENIIDNTGTMDQTRENVRAMIERITNPQL